jgi:hypothetical protein
VLPSLGVGSLSAREAEGRANVTTGDKVLIVSYTFFTFTKNANRIYFHIFVSIRDIVDILADYSLPCILDCILVL